MFTPTRVVSPSELVQKVTDTPGETVEAGQRNARSPPRGRGRNVNT